MFAQNIELLDLRQSIDDHFAKDVTHGLSQPQKIISPKYFYDQRGSELFEEICKLDEYYVTRTETQLLRRHANDISNVLGARCLIIEFGSGSSTKTRILLNALKHPAAYIPIDISKSALQQSTHLLSKDFPKLKISALCADFTAPLALPEQLYKASAKKVGYFPGSTLGNFSPSEALEVLKRIATLLGHGAKLIIGIDLIKSRTVLEAAYNDRKGVTAAFNLNLLERMNRELGATFKTAAFRHKAFFNTAKHRIEMHIESVCKQSVQVAGRVFDFNAGETIHTENSYKYSHESFTDLAHSAGFSVSLAWTSREPLFAIYCLEVQWI